MNQSQVLVAFGILDLITADRIDLASRCSSPKVMTWPHGDFGQDYEAKKSSILILRGARSDRSVLDR